MLDFIILLAFSVVLGLTIVLVLYYVLQNVVGSQNKKSSKGSDGTSSVKLVPGWDRKPSDPENGDLDELSKHGSLYEYLLHLHQNGQQPITMFWWGQQRVVSICSPELFKDTIKLTNRPKLLFTLFEPLITADSIQYANGQEWEDRRKWLYESLKGTFLEGYVPIFVKIANETARTWSKLGHDEVVELQEEFLTMTIKGITRTCFGSVFNNEDEMRKMTHIYHQVFQEMEQRMHIGPPEPGSDREKEFNDGVQQMRDKILSVVERRQSGEEKEDIPFIDALLQSGVSHDQIIADGISFMVGGLHTSGYLLVWTIHYLTLNQDVYHNLVEEMKERVGSDQQGRLKDYAYDPNTLLRQVLNETLRLSVLAPYAARYSDDDIVAGGYHIPANTPIVISLGVSLKNETIWKDTEKFDHTQCSHLQGKDTMAFAPFGHGRRKCPGYVFSYVEVSVFLTILLQQFTIKPVGEAKDVGRVHGLVTTPKEPLKYHIHPIEK
ncbi:cytochrome P450 20A1-like [Dysidea avara]|uniref:cytochrome P450 20A1-like n=1 Tax=Dysidea avara TaxID=196820 RepID=UPI0033290BB8